MGFAFGVLFVIFGGGYYLIRYLLDSGAKEASEVIYRRDKKSTDDFISLVCSDEVDREISLLYSDKCYSSIAAKAWSFAKNEDWFAKLDTYSIQDMIYRAGYGKLGRSDVTMGICANYIKPAKKVKTLEAGEAKGKMVLWIADQIRNHGVDTRVIAESYDGRVRYLTAEHPFDLDDRTYIFEQALSSYKKNGVIKDTYPEREKKY